MPERNSWEDTLGGALSPGDVVAQKYRVERVIGRGGMGVVVQAWHLDFDERVAIKFLLPTGGDAEAARERFGREARATFKLKGEHAVRVIDVGETESGMPFIVMEYLEGSDLADILAELKRLPIGDAVDYILQACDAVAEAHAQGIVHRDLKPENLFVTHRPDGSPAVKVLDFGLSKVRTSSGARALTTANQVMGTPHYMSPEQWLGAADVGPPADLWALAVILYELITGQPPFRGDKLAEICARVLDAEPPPMALYRSEVPIALEAVLRACLQKDPTKRFPNVGDFAVRLSPFAHREGRVAAKRASLVLRSAGIEVDGTIESLTIAPTSDATQNLGEVLTADLASDAALATEIRRAHAVLDAAERAASPTAALVAPEAKLVGPPGLAPPPMRPPGRAPPPMRPPGRAPPPMRPPGLASQPMRPPVLASPPMRPRADTPTAAFDPNRSPTLEAPRPLPDELPRPSPPAAVAAPEPLGSPWAGAPADVAVAVAGHSQARAPTMVAVGTNPSTAPRIHLNPRRAQGRLVTLFVGLALLVVVLAVVVMVNTGRRSTAASDVSAVPLTAMSHAPPIDPVDVLAAPRAEASSVTRIIVPARGAGSARFVEPPGANSVVGSDRAAVPEHGVISGKRKIPTTID